MTRDAAHRAFRARQSKPLRLLCIVAHPDDESLGLGGILAKYGAAGIDTYLVTATRGERGWFGSPDENPGPVALGQIREQELRGAAGVLGIREVTILDHHDGELETVDQGELQRELVEQIRRIRPDVVVTFDHNGVYGHPDHIVVTRATTAAIVAAAASNFHCDTRYTPHAVAKLYYFAWTQEVQEGYEQAFGELRMLIDGVERHAITWPHWTVSSWIDTSDHWTQVWDAIRCHRSQLPAYQKLLDLPDEYHQALWGQLTFHRVFSLVPTQDREDDLFAGLRDQRGRRARVPPAGSRGRECDARRPVIKCDPRNRQQPARRRTAPSNIKRSRREEIDVMQTKTDRRTQECVYSFIGDRGAVTRGEIGAFFGIDQAVAQTWLRRQANGGYFFADEFGSYSTSCPWPRVGF
jgi:LmbE family N-acetylglucosaminyl deacetylase